MKLARLPKYQIKELEKFFRDQLVFGFGILSYKYDIKKKKLILKRISPYRSEKK